MLASEVLPTGDTVTPYPVSLGSTGGTGISTWAGITSSVSTACAAVLCRSPGQSTARCQTHARRTTVRHRPSLWGHQADLSATVTPHGYRHSPGTLRNPRGQESSENWPRGAAGRCVCPQGAALTTVPPTGQGGGRAPFGAEDYTRTRHGHLLGAQSTLPAQPPLQPIGPPEWPGMKNLISRVAPRAPARRGTET